MYFKTVRNKRSIVISILIGIVLLAFGTIWFTRYPDVAGNIAMLLGMFSGFGAVFVLIGVIQLFRLRFTPAKKLREEEIRLKDERIIQVTRAAYTISSTAASLLFAVMAFVLVLLDYKIPAIISAGALLIQALVFTVSYAILNKKM
jgi:hypothetical protein